MIVCHTAAELRTALAGRPGPHAMVPTMGALHAGHTSLMERARDHARTVSASVFVNPHQFNEQSDYTAYPRSEAADIEAMAAAGVDVAYVPDEPAVWGGEIPDLSRWEIPGLTDQLEGAWRPRHLPAVASVVDRLFDQARPDLSLFGEKDYQQLLMIRHHAAARTPPLEIIPAPVVREADGLALSSRNQLLDAPARRQAAQLPEILGGTVREVEGGGAPQAAAARAERALAAAGFAVDYVTVRRADDLAEPGAADRELVALAAARAGGVRLLDAMPFALST